MGKREGEGKKKIFWEQSYAMESPVILVRSKVTSFGSPYPPGVILSCVPHAAENGVNERVDKKTGHTQKRGQD